MFIAGLLPAAALAQAAKPPAPRPAPAAAGGYSVCHEAALAYDDALKNMAHLNAEGFLDDSAPRATMRAADATAWAAAAQANLELMGQAHCAVPELPVTRDVYYQAAMECRLAKVEDDIKAKCNQAQWSPGPRWAAAKRPKD